MSVVCHDVACFGSGRDVAGLISLVGSDHEVGMAIDLDWAGLVTLRIFQKVAAINS
jgi:hypothetical protein